ncbi:hypothetical protein F2Q68_00032264 [Brassica cretica]|uniref:Uncharacterized protein n=3 Tax=Brassica TaxID=3705 RepID=A0A8S9GA74_BRACR|nr:hypothetical protein F2Q68_00032264 [Brassica cretica]
MSTTEIYRLIQYDEKNQRIQHLPTRNQPDTRGTLISNFDSQTQVTMADSPLWTIDAEINVSRQALHRNSQPRQAPLLQYRFFSTEFASAVSQVRWEASTSCHILCLCCDLIPLSMTSGRR